MQITLTEGKVAKSLILFSLPMIAGNLLQQLYNVADTLIVGQTIGAAALAAVGSAYALMVLLTSIILGLSMGSGVVFSQLYGRGALEEMKTALVNAFAFILAVSILINILAFCLLDQFVLWLQIPTESASMMREYLWIIFFGILFVTVYNFFAAALRSVGNTVIPLLFLAISAILNIVLDLVFILNFHMGIAGAALATVLAQGVSAVGVTLYFFKKAPLLRPSHCHFRLDKGLLRMILQNSILTAVQQSIMNLGILMVQGLVNSFGFVASAAFATAVKIDAFAYMPVQDFGNAFSTFVAQNYGAQKPDRIKAGFRTASLLSICFCIVISILVVLFAKPLMLLFVQATETAIIETGVHYLAVVGSCYAGIGLLFLLYGLYRGLGNAGMSIVLTVISLGSRVLLAYTLSVPFGLTGVWLAVPIGWALADGFGFLWYFWKKSRLLPSHS